jgi:toxin-antitoxin system PIN domain toxin
LSILVDTNLLVYAAMPTSRYHERARGWLQSQFDNEQLTVGLTWQALYGFMRLISSRTVAGPDAIEPRGAWQAAEAFRLQPNARIVAPGANHSTIAAELVGVPGLRSNDLPDVQLAATAIEHGLELCSHDHGFARFPGLRWSNPLDRTSG